MKPSFNCASWMAGLDRLRDHPILASLRYGVMWSLVPAVLALIPLYFFVSPERDWNLRIMDAYLASLGFMGPLCALFIGHYLSKFYKVRCYSGPVALAVYLAILPQWPMTSLQILEVLRNTFTSGPFVGFFSAIVLGGLVVWVRRKWRRRFVGEAVSLLFGFLLILFLRLNHYEIHQAIRVLIGKHIAAADNLSAALVVIGSMNVLWFLGLQGSSMIGSFVTGVYAQLAFDNMQAAAGGHALRHVVTLSFLNYVFIGGAGACVVLPFFMVRARSKKVRILGGASLLPVLFNVNESLIYLMPLVLNTYFLIPFLVAPLFTTATTFLAVKWGFIPHFCFYIPGLYYLPSPIMGMVATTPNFTIPHSWRGLHEILDRAMESGAWRTGILSLLQITVVAFLYYPFFKAYEKNSFEQEERAKMGPGPINDR